MNETDATRNHAWDEGEPEIPEQLPAEKDGNPGLRRVLEELLSSGLPDEDLGALLNDLAARIGQGEDLQEIRTVLLAESRRWSGPIPSPEHLAGYESVLQGLADRIVSMWEQQQAHRVRMESSGLEIDRRIVIADIIQSYSGTALSFVSAMAFLIAGVWLAVNGHWEAGLPLSLGPPGILFAMFAYQFWPLVKKRGEDTTDDVRDD